MIRLVRIVLVSAAALAAGVSCSLAIAGQREATGAAATSKAKGKSAKRVRHTSVRRSRAIYRVRRTRGRAFVPKSALGPRWQLIGTTVTTTTAPPAVTTTPRTTTYTTPTNPTETNPGAPVLALGVSAGDDPWYLRTGGRTTLTPPGHYRVQLQNWGNATHDLVVLRSSDSTRVGSTGDLDPSSIPGRPSTVETTVDFSRPGSYLLFCSIGDHATAHGMQTTITVSAG